MKNFIFGMVTLFSMSALAFPQGKVKVGGDANLDACGGYGIVTVSTVLYTTDKNGFVDFKKIDAAQGVSMCDSQTVDGVEYVGVVYSEKGKDCGVGSSIEKKEEYKGSCKSGWVKAVYVDLIAG